MNDRMQRAAEKVKTIVTKDGRVRRVYVLTFGCQQNEADSEKLLGMAGEMGYLPTKAPEEADLILVNTCAVRDHAEKRALSIIGSFKHLRAKNPELLVGVCGCMAARGERVEQLRQSYPYVSFVLRPSDLDLLPERVLSVLTRHRRCFDAGEGTPAITEGIPTVRSSHFRALVTVMYGCNNFCSYCIVPHTRDRERSRDSAAVVAEVRSLVEAGYKEIMLLGQNVNSYKSDISFAELLRRCDAIPGDYVLRFMSSHPKDMPEELISAMAECTHVETHFHLPVQSGSNKVLKEMNRRYDTEKYLSLVASLREKVPHIVLTSDVMVGFPGETEEDFEDTLTTLRRAEFDLVYSFLYSPRPGTPAAEREDQVPEDVKSERFARLLRVQDEISLAKNQKEVGKTLRVLWCEPSKEEGVYSGRTKGGKLVHAPFPSSPIGTFRSVRIERAEPYALIGTPADE